MAQECGRFTLSNLSSFSVIAWWFTLRKEFSAQVYTSCTERFSSNIDGSDFLTFTSFIHLEFISRYVNWRWKFFHMHTVFRRDVLIAHLCLCFKMCVRHVWSCCCVLGHGAVPYVWTIHSDLLMYSSANIYCLSYRGFLVCSVTLKGHCLCINSPFPMLF